MTCNLEVGLTDAAFTGLPCDVLLALPCCLSSLLRRGSMV